MMIAIGICVLAAAAITIAIMSRITPVSRDHLYQRINAEIRSENKRGLNDPYLYIRRAGDR